jgi:hypothetical protein
LSQSLFRAISFFLQDLQAQGGTLYGGHLLWAFHFLPFSDVCFGATAAQAQLTTQLTNGNAWVFDLLGHG